MNGSKRWREETDQSTSHQNKRKRTYTNPPSKLTHQDKKWTYKNPSSKLTLKHEQQLASVFNPAFELRQHSDTAQIPLNSDASRFQNCHNQHTAQIAYSLENLQLQPPRRLYEDVHGEAPVGHSELGDFDMHNEELDPQQYEQEVERARALSKKLIRNAPPWNTELPREEMEDITMEELIIYFPNHVMRWPVLALLLRRTGWDQLFYRTARLINLARDSHYYDREYKHAEAWPCMMKVETAIQELEPTYTLQDHDRHWAYRISQIPDEWFEDNCILKPRRFIEEASRKVTLEEIASYVGHHEFENWPFSQKVREASFQYQQSKKSSFPFISGISGSRQYASTQKPLPQMRRGKRDGSRFSDVDMTDVGEFADVEDEVTESDLPKGICPRGLNCHKFKRGLCRLSHPAPEDKEKQRPRPEQDKEYLNQSRVKCKYGKDCTNKSCTYSHPGRKESNTLPSRGPPSDLSKAPCRYGSKCRDRKKCPYLHENSKEGNTKPQTREDPRRKTLCTMKPVCKRANCAFAHRSPAAPPNTKVNVDQMCRWEAACTNKRCDKNHPSPATKNSSIGVQDKPRKERKEHRQDRQRGPSPGPRLSPDYSGEDEMI